MGYITPNSERQIQNTCLVATLAHHEWIIVILAKTFTMQYLFLQSQLQDANSIFTIVTGSIGAITGTIALIVSYNLQYKVTVEPAFKNIWNQLGSDVGIMTDLMKQSLTKVRTDQDNAIYIISFGTPFNEYDNKTWSYDPKFKRKLHNLLSRYNSLCDDLREYNNLKYHTTDKFISYLSSSLVLSTLSSKKQPDAVEHLEEFRALTRRYGISIDERGNIIDAIIELTASKDYNYDVNWWRNKTLKAAKSVSKLIPPIEAKLSFYNNKFNRILPVPTE